MKFIFKNSLVDFFGDQVLSFNNAISSGKETCV